MTNPITLTDDALMARVAALAARSRETTAELIAHLVELERRGLHLACGFNSLFGYCRRVLHCSEAASFDRMRAAHAARRFPVVLVMLADGALHLTAVRLLSPHLKDEDHLALLGGAIRKSGRDVRKLIARWFPRPDVPVSVRKVPMRTTSPAPTPTSAAAGSGATPSARSAQSAQSPSLPKSLQPPLHQSSQPSPRPSTQPSRPPVAPLSADRYAFRFTGDHETEALLREARELLSHAPAKADVAAIFKRGLQLVVAEARRHRFAGTGRPRPGRDGAPRSRAIPAAVERAVWERDGGRCAFVGRSGARCEERRFLEFHHRRPWAVGGPPTVENIALRCHAHNQYEAEAYFAPIRRERDDA